MLYAQRAMNNPSMKTLGNAAAERDTRLRARRGLAIYFALLVPLSAVLETLMIVDGALSLVWALMWTPAAASILARLILREGLADVSFRLGGRQGAKAIVLAVLFPIAIGLISYGIAWSAGLAHFSPQPDALAAGLVEDSTPPTVVFAINLALAATVVAVFSAGSAAGEEIGWRGYMLTRLIDAGVPRPVLASGVIWGLWHVPLILGGVYLAGPPPILSALCWMVVATSASFVFARLRLETGSIWPAIALHAAWNSVIQVAFDPASTGPGATLWVGESGIIVMLTMIAAAVVFTRGRWPVRKFPEVSRDSVAAGAVPRA
ncbi:MAG TPA: type II CAAX endopeptidase family protein [Xanthobacteraceae bacterium]